MSDDGTALIASIILHPLEDTPRLMFADWLDEHDRPDEAELIRKQCELAQLYVEPEPSRYLECAQCNSIRHKRQHTNGPCRCHPTLRSIRARERELLATLSPTCPVCKGDHDGTWDRHSPQCPHCSATGLCPCTFDRGFLTTVRVPTIASVIETCSRCDGDGKAHGTDRPFEGPPGKCPVCKGLTRSLTPFTRKLLTHPLLTRIAPVDREPLAFEDRWLWHNHDHVLVTANDSEADHLPEIVFSKLKGHIPRSHGVTRMVREYLTREAASASLAVAMCGVVRGLAT